MKKGNLNIGYSDRLDYDDDVYPDKLTESVSPGQYRLERYQMHNCNGCLSTLGPRSGYRGYGVSTTVGHRPDASQRLVDIESVLTNRNLKSSKGRSGRVNHIDVSRFKLQHPRVCDDRLNPEATHLSYPAYNYKELPTNRFFNLPRDPQAHIFWDFAANTSLEERDNFVPSMPIPMDVRSSLPVDDRGKIGSCGMTCTVDSRCPKRHM